MKTSFTTCLIILLFFVLMNSCRNPETTAPSTEVGPITSDMKESLINDNRRRMREEVIRINNYISRNGLKMESTETGARYRILNAGKGPVPTLLSRISLNYQLSLLDGSVCYSSDSNGALNFILGQSEEPSGLQEVLLRLPQGSIAEIIVPSYLAFGLSGDGDCISGNESLVYRVELLKVIPN